METTTKSNLLQFDFQKLLNQYAYMLMINLHKRGVACGRPHVAPGSRIMMLTRP